MTAEHPPTGSADPVAYKIPRPLRARLHRIRDYYAAQLGRSVTLPEALERMAAECERIYGINHPPAA